MPDPAMPATPPGARSRHRAARLIAIVGPVVLAVAVGTTQAQERYELSDDDTWTATDAPEPGTPDAELNVIRRLIAEGRFERAEFVATRWIKEHPGHARLGEAYVLRGDSLVGQDDEYEALFDYELVARTYTGAESFVTALERELDIANQYAAGRKRKLWGMRIVSATDEAEELLIRIQERLPGSRLAERAGLSLGDYYFRTRQMDLAAEMYAIFVEKHPRSEDVGKARRRLIYAHLASFKGPEFNAKGLNEAKVRLDELKAIDPVMAQRIGADALLNRVEESQAQKLLVTAGWYLKVHDPVAAELMIRRVVNTYPRSVATANAIRLMRKIVPQLPQSVRDEMPDYELLWTAFEPVEAAPAPAPASNPDADPNPDAPRTDGDAP